MLLGFAGLLASSYSFYTALPGTPESLMWSYALTGLFVGTIAIVPVVGVRAFPAAVRFSGLSFAYNMAYAVFGGLTPLIITTWLQRDVLAPAHYVGALSVLGFVLGLLPLVRQGHVARPARVRPV
jgi:hypothetical protein